MLKSLAFSICRKHKKTLLATYKAIRFVWRGLARRGWEATSMSEHRPHGWIRKSLGSHRSITCTAKRLCWELKSIIMLCCVSNVCWDATPTDIFLRLNLHLGNARSPKLHSAPQVRRAGRVDVPTGFNVIYRESVNTFLNFLLVSCALDNQTPPIVD